MRAAADVHVLVIAEALKPEDHARLADADRPIVMVLNKADLTGLGDGGPLAGPTAAPPTAGR